MFNEIQEEIISCYDDTCSVICFASGGGEFMLASWLRLTLAASITTLTTPGWLKLANDAFHLLGSAVYQCMIVPLNHESETEDLLFLVFESVSRADAVNTIAPSLLCNNKHASATDGHQNQRGFQNRKKKSFSKVF
jgi:hypothetical protein